LVSNKKYQERGKKGEGGREEEGVPLCLPDRGEKKLTPPPQKEKKRRTIAGVAIKRRIDIT